MKRGKTIVIGLTGSIGMGKSTCAKMFARLGVPVLGADRIVHALLAEGGAAFKKIKKVYPETEGHNGISRKKLAALVFEDPQKLKWLEDMLHPLVFKACRSFVRAEAGKKAKAVVLEIPLLFETGFDESCDIVVCASAPARIQKERVMSRPHMTAKKFRAVLAKQMPDAEKRLRADFVIRTDKDFADTRAQIKAVWAALQTPVKKSDPCAR